MTHPSPEAVFAALGPRPGAVWLDGAGDPDGWSILVWDPVNVLTESAGWPAAARRLAKPAPGTQAAPFERGVIGYLAYGAGADVAPIPKSAPTPEPPVWLGRYEGALCYRHRDRSWHPTGSQEVQSEAVGVLARATALAEARPPPQVRSTTVDHAAYLASVRQILALIRAGDCYQVNLTRPIHVPVAERPFEIYRRLRQARAAYGAYLQLSPTLAVLSNSPEQFLTIDGRRVTSRPIKGTRPRGQDPATDAQLAEELRTAPKDRAELTMIVDLVRNDLSRVCEVGSVRVSPRRLTHHPHVHHAEQAVHGRLLPHCDVWDAVAAAFPPGSVTGAPKIRACERINQLEASPRGVYCGAIGAVCDSGRATFNVAIRTAVVDGQRARFHVGGGIVAASDPDEEWAETRAKAVALARAFGVTSRG